MTKRQKKNQNTSFPPKSLCLPYQLPSFGMMLVLLNCVWILHLHPTVASSELNSLLAVFSITHLEPQVGKI